MRAKCFCSSENVPLPNFAVAIQLAYTFGNAVCACGMLWYIYTYVGLNKCDVVAPHMRAFAGR